MYVCLYIPMMVRFYLLKVDLVASSGALPGGGIRRNESYEKAAAREILEEVGINIENLRYLGKVNSYESYKPFPVRVFAATAINQDIKYNFEIIEAKWLAEQYIPEEYDSITD